MSENRVLIKEVTSSSPLCSKRNAGANGPQRDLIDDDVGERYRQLSFVGAFYHHSAARSHQFAGNGEITPVYLTYRIKPRIQK